MHSKGLFLDTHPKSQPEETYRDALNLSLVREEGVVCQEVGTSVVTGTGGNYRAIGDAPFPDGTQAIFMVDNEGYSKVILYDGNVTTLLLGDGGAPTKYLNFNRDYPIEATTRVDADGRKILYWTDGLNPVRRLILDGGPAVRSADSIRLFLQVQDAPKVVSIKTDNGGGILKTGAYFVGISLETNDGDQTPFLNVVGPISISDDATGVGSSGTTSDGAPPDSGTSKSIVVDLEDIDDTFTYVRAALIHGTEVRYLPRTPIKSEGTSTLRITGAEQYEPGSITEVVVNPAIYETAKSMDQESDNLYLGNLTRTESLEYQPYANAIEVETVEHDFLACTPSNTLSGNFKTFNGHVEDMRDPHTAFLNKGFKKGEVYALYISLVLKNGTETPAFHIPGRAAIAFETFPQFGQGGSNNATAASLGATGRFQLEPTAMDNGIGYWHNEDEEYPDTPDFDIKNESGNIVGTLRGAKVRHHHLCFDDDPFYMTFRGTDITGGARARTIGFKLKNIKFPNEIKDKISGYKIYYAKRGFENGRWVDQMMTAYTRYGNDNGSGQDAWKVAADGLGGGDTVNKSKYVAGQPFHLMRTRENVATLSSGYVRRLYKSAHQNYRHGTNTDSQAFMPTDNQLETGHIYKKILSAGYLDRDSTQSMGNGDIFYNKLMPASLVLEVQPNANWTNWDYDVVDIFRFKRNVYQPFQSQTLVSTGYVGNVDESETGDIFGGDTFVSFYGQLWGTPQDDGTFVVIHQGVYESSDNIGLRHEGDQPGEVYWPKGLKGVQADTNYLYGFISEDEEDQVPYLQNYIAYNDEYSRVNDLKPAFPFNPYEKTFNNFPTRVIRSSDRDKSGQRDNFRVFKENDFLDLTTQRGEIVKITSFGGGLMIHAKKALFRTMGREELEVGDVRAFVGAGDIFAQPPKEIFTTREGYAGLSHPHHAILTPGGYMFVSTTAGAVYLVADGLTDISSLGVASHFSSRVPDNADMILGFDPDKSRAFITRRDVEDPWTISYITDRKIWESFHSGNPDYYIWNEKVLSGLANSLIYVKGDFEGNYDYREGGYFDTDAPFKIETVLRPKGGDRVLHSVVVDSLFEVDDSEIPNEIFDSIEVKNTAQSTGIVPIKYFTEPDGNARRTNRIWKINKLRDAVPPSTMNGTMPEWRRKRIVSEFFQVALSYLNDGTKKLHLFGVDAVTAPSVR